MVNLEGSEKQIEWANDIRANMMVRLAEKREEIANGIAKIEARPADHPYAPQHPTMARGLERDRRLISDLDEAKGILESQTNAKWWIDNRGSLGLIVMQAIRRDLPRAI